MAFIVSSIVDAFDNFFSFTEFSAYLISTVEIDVVDAKKLFDLDTQI